MDQGMNKKSLKSGPANRYSVDDCKFEFFGFNAGEELRAFIKSLAEELQMKAPADSYLKLTLERGRNVVSGIIKVTSLAGTFIARATAEDPQEAAQRLKQAMRQQIEEWSRRRFSKISAPAASV